HPYVREMITEALSDEDLDLSNEELEALVDLQRGMVRASFGIYTTRDDIDALAKAVRAIAEDRSYYEGQYEQLESGDFQHKTFRFEPAQLFSVRGAVDAWLAD
ncbi:MAG: hypothetical protein MJE12_13820, partial [Alphaproteobacteria bacterium]|nr:hypothetical protein [Alphaproteobacteria bacterium]